MKTFDRHTIPLAALALGIVTAPACADGGSTALRDELRPEVRAIVGDRGSAAIAPFVEDATQRLEAAVAAVGSTDSAPFTVLTGSQKLALFLARGSGQVPDLHLTAQQQTQLATYVRDVVRNAVPIVRDDGAKIEAALTTSELAQLRALRADALQRFRSNAPVTPLLPGIASLVSDEATGLGPGAFVLLVTLDPSRIIRPER
jgi:hypothetical protein